MAVRELVLYPEIIYLWMNGFVFITSSMKLPREASCLRRAISGLIALFILSLSGTYRPGCGALFLVSPGGVPALRIVMNLLNVSNQKGAPNDTASTDINKPNSL